MDELLTLPEYAKTVEDPLAKGMIQQFATSSDLIEVLPFKNVTQGRNVFDRSTANPAMNFRALNEEPEISHGESEEFQDVCAPLSGLLEVDRLKKKRYGTRRMALDMQGQMITASENWTRTSIDGDVRSDIRSFDGLKVRLTDEGTGSFDGTVKKSRHIANSVNAGGAPLSLTQLDFAISRTARPTHLLMNPRLKTRLIGLSRDVSTSGYISRGENDQGRNIHMYAGLPILTGYDVSETEDILMFNEVALGGGAAQCSSIYVLSIREDGVCGIQTSPFEVIPVGHTDRGVFHRNLAEWDAGITIEDKYSAMRVSSITDAPIVA